jgi:hypothetical protein
MKTHRSIRREAIFAALGLALLTGACANYRPTSKFKSGIRSSAATATSNGTSSGNSSGGSWGYGTGGGNTTEGEHCDVGYEPETYDVEGIGYDGIIRFTVLAHSRLRVRFRAEMNDRQVAGTGFTPVYSRLGVYLKVWENEAESTMLSNGMYTEQRWSPVVDFSDSFPRVCPEGDPLCRQPVEIRIEMPNSDQQTLGTGYWTHVQAGHPWRGSLQIETDDTNSIECQ